MSEIEKETRKSEDIDGSSYTSECAFHTHGLYSGADPGFAVPQLPEKRKGAAQKVGGGNFENRKIMI